MRRILLGLVGLLAGPVSAQTADTVRDSTARLVTVWDRTITITPRPVTPPTAPTLTKLTLSPKAWSMPAGGSQFFILTPTWSDGLTRAVADTWTVTGGTAAKLTGGRLYTAGTIAGAFRIIVRSNGRRDTANITISAPVTPPPQPVDTTPCCPAPPPPAAGTYPNRPATYTRASELDFSQAIPTAPDNVDRPIVGAPAGWNMIYFGTSWARISDPSAPQSAPGVWQGTWAPGSYGGGIIGQGGGHGIGNVFTYVADGTTRLYMSMRLYFDFDASQWHPVSNKFVNIETDNGLLLVQLNEGGQWRHAEQLINGGASWWIDPGNSPGQVSNPPVPTRRWTQLEVLIDLPNRVFRIWQDGVLTTNATPTFAATKLRGVGWNAFRGGGGETLSASLGYRYDHFYLAW